MFSSRTLNSECLNDQNVCAFFLSLVILRADTTCQPFGFHLSDGTLYTYVEGDEYEDIAAMWDWNSTSFILFSIQDLPLSFDSDTRDDDRLRPHAP